MNKQQAANVRRSKAASSIWTDRKREIVRLYDSGMSQAAMAKRYGVSLAGMQKAMTRLGIAPRPRWRVGKENGRYVHGKATTIYRSRIAKKLCVKCGATTNLCVDHRNGDHYDNRPENLRVMCMPCHSRMHKTAWWAARRASSV